MCTQQLHQRKQIQRGVPVWRQRSCGGGEGGERERAHLQNLMRQFIRPVFSSSTLWLAHVHTCLLSLPSVACRIKHQPPIIAEAPNNVAVQDGPAYAYLEASPISLLASPALWLLHLRVEALCRTGLDGCCPQQPLSSIWPSLLLLWWLLARRSLPWSRQLPCCSRQLPCCLRQCVVVVLSSLKGLKETSGLTAKQENCVCQSVVHLLVLGQQGQMGSKQWAICACKRTRVGLGHTVPPVLSSLHACCSMLFPTAQQPPGAT